MGPFFCGIDKALLGCAGGPGAADHEGWQGPGNAGGEYRGTNHAGADLRGKAIAGTEGFGGGVAGIGASSWGLGGWALMA